MERQADGSVRAWVNAPPHGGEANDAVIKLVAKTLGIPKSDIQIVRGLKSRTKTVAVKGVSLDQVLSRIPVGKVD